MLGVVRRTALVACAAWEQFPASVPCMIPGGRLVLNEIATSHAFGQGGYRQDGRGRPTEDLPGDPAVLCDMGSGQDAVMGAILDIAARG